MSELQMPPRVRDLMSSMMADIQRLSHENAEREAKTNPEKYRDSTVMERGADTRHRYWDVPDLPKGKSIRFCYTKHRNVAGFYLTWTEIWSGREGYRTNFHGWETKHDAMEYCRGRLADAKKPKAERKYVLPPFKRAMP